MLDDYLSELEHAGEKCAVSHYSKALYSYTIHGYISWKDSVGTSHPANNVTVRIYNTDSNVGNGYIVGTVTTDSSGYYSATFQIPGMLNTNVFIRVLSSGLNISVKEPDSGFIYAWTSSVYTNVSSGSNVSLSYVASNDTYLGQSLGIHQALEIANRYMYVLENSYMDPINVMFPYNNDGVSYFVSNGISSTIYVLSADATDWDVLEHEYGHYVASEFGFLANVGGIHYLGDVLAVTRGKSDGIELAWNEGWATYFAINMQKRMDASLLGIPNVGDTKYTDTVDVSIEYCIENVCASYLLGESGEIAVSGILYDVTDSVDINDYDWVYCSNADVWNIIKNSGCMTLSSFISTFNNASFSTQTKLRLGITLSHFKVSALLDETISFSPGPGPTFSWEKQGGSNLYQNSSFSLVFYDSSYNQICLIPAGNTTSKTVNIALWNSIVNSGQTAYCSVISYQTDTPQTGGYFSNLLTIHFNNS